MPDDFKKKYFNVHLTEAEFKKYINYFYKINNTIIIDRQNIIYYVAEPVNN